MSATWRALSTRDIPAVVALLEAAEEVDGTGEHYDAVDIAEELAEHSGDLAADSVAVAVGSELVGMGIVRSRSTGGHDITLELWGTVHPSWRHEGLGRGILAHQVHRATEIHAERFPDRHGRLVVRPYDHNDGHVRLVRAAGFTPARHWFDMERDLGVGLPPVPPLPAGVALHRYDRSYDEAVRALYNEAFGNSYGSPVQDVEGWAAWFTGSRAFRPDLSTIALAGDQIIGLLLSYFYEADAVAAGYREAWIGQVGVVTPWRHHGLGATLIATALQEYAAAGFSKAVLDVDGESETGGLGVYARLGFGVVRKRTSFLRRLGPAGPG